MANSRKTGPQKGTLTEFPPPESGVAVADEPETAESAIVLPETPSPATGPPKRERGRPRREDPPVETNFWERVKAIARDDWGTRVYLYLYVLEPLCNLKQSGGKTYLNRYSEPVQDEHQIMLEYGSGRYRLMLALNKISPDQSNELARHEFEIYNPRHPPKIPRAAWINDARNAKWEALLPEEPLPGSATAASTIVDAMKMVSDIRRDVRDEIGQPDEPQQTRTSEVLETMKAARELFGPSAPNAVTAPPADPFDTAAKIMAMRANDPMMAVMMELLKNANTANEAARQREYELLRAQSNAAPAKTIVDQLLDIATNADKLKPLKEIFGFGAEVVTTRASRTTGMDILNNLVSGPAGAALAQGLGQLLMAAPSMFQGNPAPNGQPSMQTPPPVVLQPQVQQGPPAAETPEQRINRVGTQVTRQMIGEFFLKGATGEDFAVSMYNFWPEDTVFLQSFGAENLVDRYRKFPQAWAVLSYREADFITFMQQFCAWKAPTDEEGASVDAEFTPASDSGIEDMEDKEDANV